MKGLWQHMVWISSMSYIIHYILLHIAAITLLRFARVQYMISDLISLLGFQGNYLIFVIERIDGAHIYSVSKQAVPKT